MGKNLKGKECGKGICQRKDGLYLARFVDKFGKRHECISARFRRPETGWRMRDMLTSMTMYMFRRM